MNDYVSNRVFDGTRHLSKEREELMLKKLMTDEQIVQGLMAHAPDAGDSAYVVRLAAKRISQISKKYEEIRIHYRRLPAGAKMADKWEEYEEIAKKINKIGIGGNAF